MARGTQALRGRLHVVDTATGRTIAADVDGFTDAVTFARSAPVGFLARSDGWDYRTGLPRERVERLDLRTGGLSTIGDGYRPAADATGQHVAFIWGDNYEEIWTMNDDGSGRRLVYKSATSKVSVRWMPGGTRLAFVEDTTRGRVLSTVRTDGRHYVPRLNLSRQ